MDACSPTPRNQRFFGSWAIRLLVAFRFRSHRQLIGSTVFPIYWLALWIGIGIVVLGYTASAAVMFALGKPLRDVIREFAQLGGGAVHLVGWMTIVFAVVDRIVIKSNLVTRWTGKWDPQSLPAVRKRRMEVPRSESIAQIVVGTLFGAWAMAWLTHPHLPAAAGQAAVMIQFTEVWYSIRVPALLLVLIGPVQACVNLFRPEWLEFRSWTRLANALIGMATAGYMLNTGDLITAVNAPEAARYLDAAHILNVILVFAVVLWGLTYLGQAVWSLWKVIGQRSHLRSWEA